MMLMDRYVTPWLLGGDKKVLPQATAAMISSGRVLDFVDKELKGGGSTVEIRARGNSLGMILSR